MWANTWYLQTLCKPEKTTNGTISYNLNIYFAYLPVCLFVCLYHENVKTADQKIFTLEARKACLNKSVLQCQTGVYISFETHIFAPPLFRIIFFPLTHGLKTGFFSPKPIESSFFCPPPPRGGEGKMKNIHPCSKPCTVLQLGAELSNYKEIVRELRKGQKWF